MPTPVDPGTKLVLLVDDDDDIREVASLALELVAGFRLVTASNGHDAVLRAKEYLPDAILLDVMMPGMDGIQTLAELKAGATTGHIPVILITARVDADQVQKSSAGIIAKPFDPMSLGAEVSRLLGWAS